MKLLPALFHVCALGLVLLFNACVPSVNPLYTKETLVYRPELLGIWKDKPDSEDSWTITRLEENAYNVLIREKDTSSEFAGHVVKLGEAIFLDLMPIGDSLDKAKIGNTYQMALIPGHLIFKLSVGKNLELQTLQYEALKELLAADPKALAHGFPEKEHLVITASTPDLQNFIKKITGDKKLWSDPTALQKTQP